MLKNIKDLSDLIKLDNHKDLSSDILVDVLNIIKKESGLVLKEKDILIKKNILKVKSNSNIKFILLLHIKNINKNIKDLNQGFILEL